MGVARDEASAAPCFPIIVSLPSFHAQFVLVTTEVVSLELLFSHQ